MANKDIFVGEYEFDYLARRPCYAKRPNWLIEKCGIDENSTVIDSGCGSGITTEFLLERFAGKPGPRITAIDPSEPELSIAKSRVSRPCRGIPFLLTISCRTLIEGLRETCSVLNLKTVPHGWLHAVEVKP